MYLFLSLFLSCGPKTPTAQVMSMAPPGNVYIRNSFDLDPSSYIGRFLTDGDVNVDESTAMSTTCSAYIEHRFVEGGGVKYKEVLDVSSTVGARIGVPIIAKVGGSYGKTSKVLVQYELTGKMVSEITDPQKFSQCCTENPEHCTRRYIGEFIQGSGAIFTEVQKEGSAQGEGIDPSSGVKGGMTYSHGSQWKRGIEFPNPVYFAFKFHQTPFNESGKCDGWNSPLPQSEKGSYFVGISERETTESKARKSAVKNARRTANQSGLIDATNSTYMNLLEEDWCIDTKYENSVKSYEARTLILVQENATAKAAAEKIVSAANTATASQPSLTTPTSVPSQSLPTINAPQKMETAPSISTPVSIDSLMRSINEASFSDDKLNVILSVSGQSLTCAQVAQILNALSFDQDKMKAVQYLKKGVTDPQNSIIIEEQFNFSSEKEKIRLMFQ